jgi:flagellar export protein FliJ
MGTQQLQAARYFLSELDKMAAKQRNTIQQAELALDQQRGSWVDAKRRLTAIEKLRTQRQKIQRIADEKQQQRVQDELYSLKTSFEERF